MQAGCSTSRDDRLNTDQDGGALTNEEIPPRRQCRLRLPPCPAYCSAHRSWRTASTTRNRMEPLPISARRESRDSACCRSIRAQNTGGPGPARMPVRGYPCGPEVPGRASRHPCRPGRGLPGTLDGRMRWSATRPCGVRQRKRPGPDGTGAFCLQRGRMARDRRWSTRPLRPSNSSGPNRCPAARRDRPSSGGPFRATCSARSAPRPDRCCHAR